MKNYYKITKNKAGKYTVYAQLVGVGAYKKVFNSEAEAMEGIEHVKAVYRTALEWYESQ